MNLWLFMLLCTILYLCTVRVLGGLTCSSDGTKVVATGCAGVYTSTNAGATWTRSTTDEDGKGCWRVVASDREGKNLAFVRDSKYMYLSKDGGVTFAEAEFPHEFSGTCTHLTSSADGTKLVLSGTSENLWTSSDSATTWTRSNTDCSFTHITSSADNNKLAALGRGSDCNAVFTSGDSGVTWTKVTSTYDRSRTWNSIASSADGTKLVATRMGNRSKILTSSNGFGSWTEAITPDFYSKSDVYAFIERLIVTDDGNPHFAVINVAADSEGKYRKLGLGERHQFWIWDKVTSIGSWKKVTAIKFPERDMMWSFEITSSADGTKLFVCDSEVTSAIWSSRDSGVTWTRYEIKSTELDSGFGVSQALTASAALLTVFISILLA